MQFDEVLLSGQESRQIDRVAIEEMGLSGLLLMENAARGVCDAILSMGTLSRILIVCGPGNNGGDGFALARQLAANAKTAQVLLISAGKQLSADAEYNRNAWLACGGFVHEDTSPQHLSDQLLGLTNVDLVVDCLLGTGVRGAPRSPFSEAIQAINQSPAKVLAVDVPSGLNCDTGTAAGECVQADRTVTFVGMKRGFVAETAGRFTGEISIAHIGLPKTWVSEWLNHYRASSESVD